MTTCLARLRRAERVDHFETVRITKAGRLVDVSITVSPIRDGAGRVVGASKIARGISERRRIEVVQARLAAVIEWSDDVIVSKTLDGIITSWNPAAGRLFGWTAAEAIGKHITLIIPAERRAEEDDVLARLRRGERVDHFETVRVTKDGRFVDVSTTVSPIKDGAGRIVGASKIARDISERRRIEQERVSLLAREQEARQAAEALNRTKDEFLATMPHELRTSAELNIGLGAYTDRGRDAGRYVCARSTPDRTRWRMPEGAPSAASRRRDSLRISCCRAPPARRHRSRGCFRRSAALKLGPAPCALSDPPRPRRWLLPGAG